VIFCLQGKAWQFKDFPFKGVEKGDLVDTFSKIMGAYFYYSDEKVSWGISKTQTMPSRTKCQACT
jgi:hypothetical protein